jgi:Sodium/hydrogen exchanger family/Response regulator receiver domain
LRSWRSECCSGPRAGGIEFDDAQLARSIGVIALIVILFEGGLTTDWRDLRPVLVPASLLGTVGVAVTAAVTAGAAYALFDLSWISALLLGAIVGSTDAAAVFATLRFTPLRRRVATLLAAESGANDPMAVTLTAGFISWLTLRDYGAADMAVQLLRELGLGLVIGVGLGLIASRVFARLSPELGNMPRKTGLQAARELARRRPELRILILSMYDNEQFLFEALKAGASGYVLKSEADDDIVDACRAAMRGQPFLYPTAMSSLMRDCSRGTRASPTR